MMKEITKRMSIIALALIAAITTIFGVTAITANKVSADETYSETWVIKEECRALYATGVDDVSSRIWSISGQYGDITFATFGEKANGNTNSVNLIVDETTLALLFKNTNMIPYDIVSDSPTTYDKWKDTYGKVTFYEDTSTEKFSDLRAWLEQNATQIFVQVWYNGDIAQCVSVPLVTTYEQLDKTKAPTRAGYTCIGWSNEENGEVATGTLRYSDSSGVLYIQVYPVYAKEAPAQAAKYTVTFKDGEKILYTLSAESGKAINLSEYPEINESAAKTGYTFKGWAARIDGAVIAKNGYLPNITADTILYAVYEKTSGTDFPSDNPSDNPDTPADDKPSDTDKPADKPSDGSGDNITLDKSDVKKYVGITLGALGVLLVMAFMVNVFGRRR